MYINSGSSLLITGMVGLLIGMFLYFLQWKREVYMLHREAIHDRKRDKSVTEQQEHIIR